jgi:hypothetical protein
MRYLLPVLALCLAGCATHQFADPKGNWKTRSGQLLYHEGTRSFVGELTVSSLGPDARLEFSKGPGLALMRVQRDATHARFEGPLARLPHTTSLPASKDSRDAGWLSVLDRSVKESKFEVTSGGAQLSVQLAPGR